MIRPETLSQVTASDQATHDWRESAGVEKASGPRQQSLDHVVVRHRPSRAGGERQRQKVDIGYCHFVDHGSDR